MSKKILILAILTIFFISCQSKKQDSTPFSFKSNTDNSNSYNEDDSSENDDPVPPLTGDEISVITGKMHNADKPLFIQNKNIKKHSYTISNSYQNDPLKIKLLQTANFKKIAVVGSNNVSLYQNIDGKKSLATIPKGEIIPVNEVIVNPKIQKDEWDNESDFYEFNKELNYWIKTEYNGSKGYVFGSYLVYDDTGAGIVAGKWRDEDINKVLNVISFYYKKGEKQDDFYNFNGTKIIPGKLITYIEKNRFILQKPDQYYLSIENPDDMIALYKESHFDHLATTFITTDFYMHILHLLFDRMLQSTEERILLRCLKSFTILTLNDMAKIEDGIKDDEADYKEVFNSTKNYFLVAANLLNIVDQINPKYKDLPDDVKKETELIINASGTAISPIMKYEDDYSQFIPRGHYTKTGNLKLYFKAMIWYGRIHFYLKDNDDNSRKLTSMALLFTKIAKENKDIFSLWRALYDPITYLIGESDDYTLYQYLKESKNVDFADFGSWLKNKDNINKFIKTALNDLPKARISSSILDQNKDGKLDKSEMETPRGFRVFGQRFVFDSYIFSQLTTPRVGDPNSPDPNKRRGIPTGLDIMGIFGNKLADGLLKTDKEKYINFKENYEALKKEYNSFKTDDHRKTFYNSYLKILQEIALFDSSMPFYFTKETTWENKALLTAHGSWAELRHDTLLYVKQSYGENMGKGPERTWLLDKIEKPTGYIEPNLGAMYWIQSILDDSLAMLGENGFMDDNFKKAFTEYKNIIDASITIVENEASDNKITSDANEFIYKIPYLVQPLILASINGNIVNEDELKMALIADVHTDSSINAALEVAIGKPYKILVALNDGQGGKRIAEGYTFSYYEFLQPISDRLTDEAWKAKVYGNPDSVDKLQPDWEKEIIAK